MSGALQAVFQNQRSFVLPLPAIGSAYEGGFFAGQISTAGNGIADYNLVVGPVSSAQTTTKWKTSNTVTAGTTSNINGPANSSAMNNASHPAAQFCKAVTTGGYTDWYMPAKNELEVCYYNLKPTTTSNDVSSGINPNAVPARASNYTSGTPAQTSASDFQNPSGTERYIAAFYWSSTECAQATTPYYYRLGQMPDFGNGQQTVGYKNYNYRVRAVRRVAV